MKIAMIGQKGAPTKFGGIERHVEAISTRLGKAGFEVILYTRKWYAPENLKFRTGVAVIEMPTINTKHLDAIVHTVLATIDAMRRKVDIIHYHGVGPSLMSWIPRLFAPRIRVVSTFHCMDRKHQKWNFFGRLSLRIGEWASCNFAHATIVVSKTLQSYCNNLYNSETIYIPNGVDVPNTPSKSVMKKFKLKPNGYILMVSRLVPHKGAHYLIEAFQRLAKKSTKNESVLGGKKLVIVGGSAFTDNYVTSLKAMVQNDKNIILTGSLPPKDVNMLFANSYAVVHPSESEGLPLAIIEAMSFGKTVLASDIPEITEVTRDHGLGFKNKSIDDLERKLRYILSHKDDMKIIGKSAKAFVLKHYRWDDVAKSTAELYESLKTQPVKTPSRARNNKQILATVR